MSVRERDGWTAVRLNEASLMEPAVIEALNAHVEQLLAQGKNRLVLDFKHVEYISSSMVGVLVGTRQSVTRTGGQLILCGLRPRLHELLRITRLERMFIVEPDLSHAMKRARGEGREEARGEQAQ